MESGGVVYGVGGGICGVWGGVYGVAGRGCGASVALNLKNEKGGGLVWGGPHRSDPSQIILLPPPLPKDEVFTTEQEGGGRAFIGCMWGKFLWV